MGQIDYRLECGCVVYTDGARTFCEDCGWEVRPRAPVNQADHDYPMSAAWRGIPTGNCSKILNSSRGYEQPDPDLAAATVVYLETRIGEVESLSKWVLAKHQQHVNASRKRFQDSL